MSAPTLRRRDVLKLGAGAPLATMAGTTHATAQERVLRYGISLADIPLTSGQPDRGAGGYQFTGHTIYDGLVAWEMNVADRPGKLVPGLATEWQTDPADRRKWLFKLRDNVRFHDGSLFDADAVVWNLEKVLNPQAPHYDQRQSAQVRPRLPSVASWRKVDAATVEITTRAVDSLFPYQMLWFLVSSPAHYEALGRDWQRFATQPSGTGPFKLTRLVPREQAELVRNPDYWDRNRLAKVDRIVLTCLPEPLARTNSLLSGAVDLIESPAPDVVAQIERSGARIMQNVTPHVWNYHPSLLPGSPWRDVKLRRAANLAIDRDGLVQLLGGLAKPAAGQVDPASPWFGNPEFRLRYDVDAARRLMGEAGYSATNRLKTTFIIANGGTGQMLSLPMNEFIQENFKEIFIDLEFRVVELEALYTAWRLGAAHESMRGIQANNIAYVTSDPLYAFIRFFHSNQVAPTGVNWGHYQDPETDRLIEAAQNSFDTAEQDRLMARVHERIVNDAVLIWAVHDTNPRALGRNVRGYTQAQHWFQDLTTLA